MKLQCNYNMGKLLRFLYRQSIGLPIFSCPRAALYMTMLVGWSVGSLHVEIVTLVDFCWPQTYLWDLRLALLTLDDLADLELTLLTLDWPCWPWTDLGLTLLTLDWPCCSGTDLAELWLTLLTLLTLNWPCWLWYDLVDHLDWPWQILLILEWPCTNLADLGVTLQFLDWSYWPFTDVADLGLKLLT